MRAKIVLVDDDHEMRSMLEDYLQGEGFEVLSFELATKAFQFLADDSEGLQRPHLVLSDVRMPEMDGISFAKNISQRFTQIPVVLMTAFGTIENAIEGIKAGAFDYITKPFKLSEVSVTLERALRYSELQRENEQLRKQLARSGQIKGLVGKSREIRDLTDIISQLSQATASVLIQGESGTGKEVVARTIHELSPRAKKPFIAINCTALPESLLESELFGHAKGAFTGADTAKKGLFEEAHGGTLFLDEIGDMETGLQAKLLRVLQERKVKPLGQTQSRDIDVRIIAATHKDLKAAIKSGHFREDLFYRLSVVPLMVPPLRSRREDIPLLAEYFLGIYCERNGLPRKKWSPEALEKLSVLSWPGNVRELENLTERLVVLSRGDLIEAAAIPDPDSDTIEGFWVKSTQDYPTMEELEKRYIRLVLDKTGGGKEKAAQILGINRRTLYRKEREYGFE